jgi:hypothetical protein
MAESIGRQLFGDKYDFESAGLRLTLVSQQLGTL